jgi:caa(3)-type oxidase subunit IV
MSDSAHGQEAAHEHSPRPYFVVFFSLIALTLITVGISYLDLGYAGNKVLGLAVAIIKASLVIGIFMHLKTDGKKDRFLVAAIIFPICLFCLLLMALCPDVVFHGGDQARHMDPGPWDNVGKHAAAEEGTKPAGEHGEHH